MPHNPGVLTSDQLQRLARLCEVIQEAYPYTLDDFYQKVLSEHSHDERSRGEVI